VSGRRKKGGHAEFHLDERWMTSYADMITVLMCLFIVLYAMSTIDASKFKTLANSLATGFGQTPSQTVDTAKGVVVPKDLVKKKGTGFTTTTAIAQDLKTKLDAALKKAGSTSKAQVTTTSTTVTIGLVGSIAYFGPDDASLRRDAFTSLKVIAPVLGEQAGSVTVEGHADPHGSAGEYSNDWALAAARATTVLTYLVDHGVPGDRISAVSYGSSRPVTSGANTATRNRRVDIVLHAVSAKGASTPAPAPASTPGDVKAHR
jgi:chemotaxis protein MotB